MNKTILTILSFLFFSVPKAQVATFLSLGVTISQKNAEGNLAEVKRTMIQEMQIIVDLDQNKIQILSKGMLSRDTFKLKKEITVLNEIKSPDKVKDQKTRLFSGIDGLGTKCIIRLKPIRDARKMLKGELEVEYVDRTEIYKLRTPGYNLFHNEG